MTLALLIIAWIALPVGFWLILRPKTAYALPIIAIVISITLLAIAQWMQTNSTIISLSSAQNGVPQSTTYVISSSPYFQNLSLNHLLISALSALIARFGQNLTLRITPLGFWMSHLGCSVIGLLPTIATTNMPRRYIDYPTWFAWTNRLNFTGSTLFFLGFGILILLTLTALTQTLLRRKT